MTTENERKHEPTVGRLTLIDRDGKLHRSEPCVAYCMPLTGSGRYGLARCGQLSHLPAFEPTQTTDHLRV